MSTSAGSAVKLIKSMEHKTGLWEEKMIDLKSIPTASLVEELRSREGVIATDVDPYEEWSVQNGLDEDYRGDGPMVILMIND